MANNVCRGVEICGGIHCVAYLIFKDFLKLENNVSKLLYVASKSVLILLFVCSFKYSECRD